MEARRGGVKVNSKPGKPPRIIGDFPQFQGFAAPKGEGSFKLDINFDVDLGENDDVDQADFLKALDSPEDRLKYMMRRHKRTLSGFDQEHHILNQVLNSVGQLGGNMADIKFFIQRRHELLGKRADYDLKMSKELQVWRELAEQEDTETPLELFISDPNEAAFTRPALGDFMDLQNLLPGAAGDA